MKVRVEYAGSVSIEDTASDQEVIEAGIQQAIEDDCQERRTTQAQDLEDDMLERDAYQDAMEKRWGQR
jgi:hypothetical protein